MVNPLTRCLEDYSLPPFATLHVSDIVPAVRAAIAEMALDVNAIEDDLSDPDADISWEAVMDRLEIIDDPLNRLWRIVIHLASVANSPELRAAQAEVQAEVLTIQSRRAQSVPVFHAMQRLRASPEFHTALTSEQQRILDRAILEATLSGVALTDNAKARFNDNNVRLRELGNQFTSNVLDATKAVVHVVHDKKELDGIPAAMLAAFAQKAAVAGYDAATPATGPWMVSFYWPYYNTIQKECTNRSLREAMYRARRSVASSPPYDNTPIIQEMLQLRHERAHLLGFNSFAQLSVEDKMAPSVSAVEDMLELLREKCVPLARAELRELEEFVRAQGPNAAATLPLQPWDVSFWASKLRQHRYALNDDLIKPYFALPRVLAGLFAFLHQLFGILIEPADDPEEMWHPDVLCYQMRAVDLPGAPIVSQFYLDLYERTGEKRVGDWIEVVVGRSKVLRPEKHNFRLPVFALMLNHPTPPNGSSDSMAPTLAFPDVSRLFHCFGYGLRVALTSSEYTATSRPHGVEWDAVEVPSKLMANFCYHRDTIRMVSGHVDTGEPLPDAIFDQLVASRRFMAATTLLDLLSVASVDIALHHDFDPTASTDKSVFDVYDHVVERFSIGPSMDRDRRLCSLEHIFPGPYAAGFYSYLWSEAMSADAFTRFNEATTRPEWEAVGRDCRDSVFAMLGAAHPLEAFKRFRGRPPNMDSLLRSYGLD